jgi:uncharacterized membrane protein YhiD involved in acid resistance
VPDWLAKAFVSEVDTSVPTLILRQLIALGLGCIVGLVYRLALGSGGGRQRIEMMGTLVLLTVLIAMMTAVIGDNIARAFSIVGALSIVRFRTVVEDSRDTAFVICAVAVGLAVGAGHVLIPLITIPIVAGAAMIFRPRDAGPLSAEDDRNVRIVVRSGSGHATDAGIRQALLPFADAIRVLVIETARQGAALETTYSARLRQPEQAHALIAALNGVEGVQTVELRQL